MTNATATLHQLHLLFVFLHDCAVGICIAIDAYHKAVGKAHYLIRISNT